jgi:hypothetical protein
MGQQLTFYPRPGLVRLVPLADIKLLLASR